MYLAQLVRLLYYIKKKKIHQTCAWILSEQLFWMFYQWTFPPVRGSLQFNTIRKRCCSPGSVLLLVGVGFFFFPPSSWQPAKYSQLQYNLIAGEMSQLSNALAMDEDFLRRGISASSCFFRLCVFLDVYINCTKEEMRLNRSQCKPEPRAASRWSAQSITLTPGVAFPPLK